MKAKHNNLVWRLLRKNISIGQIAGYAIANLVGLSIVLIAIQFYQDISIMWSDEDAFLSKDYTIISKRVALLDSFKGNVSFSEEDIEDLKNQPWAKKVGTFTSADFEVDAVVSFGGRGMSTHLFLEAIPDEFLDITPEEWEYEPGQKDLPIIISKEYLTLYNFGFASSRGLPQLSESAISMVPLRLFITDEKTGAEVAFDARVVGFSSRLNTIAVPQKFMDWANAEYAVGEPKEPSRLIIETSSKTDPNMMKYFEENDYEVAGDKADNGKAQEIFSLITIIVASVGGVISLLAFFILVLSIYLLLLKNKEKLHNLMLLGYSPSHVARNYYLMIGIVNCVVLLVSIGILTIASSLWSIQLENLGLKSSPLWISIAIGAFIMLIVTLSCFVIISRNVKKNF